MRGRIKEDDSSVPSPDGAYAYLRKFREGGQHEMFGRMPRNGGETEIVLDGDALAADHEYFKFGGARHSPDHKMQAWSADLKGSEYFAIRVRDWATKQDLGDVVEETDGTVVWSADCKSFFYVKLDDNHRPMQVWRHRLGTPQAGSVGRTLQAAMDAESHFQEGVEIIDASRFRRSLELQDVPAGQPAPARICPLW